MIFWKKKQKIEGKELEGVKHIKNSKIFLEQQENIRQLQILLIFIFFFRKNYEKVKREEKEKNIYI